MPCRRPDATVFIDTGVRRRGPLTPPPSSDSEFLAQQVLDRGVTEGTDGILHALHMVGDTLEAEAGVVTGNDRCCPCDGLRTEDARVVG
jgi:hypothetical protein